MHLKCMKQYFCFNPIYNYKHGVCVCVCVCVFVFDECLSFFLSVWKEGRMGPSFHSMRLEQFGGMGCWYCSKLRFCLSHCYDDEEQRKTKLQSLENIRNRKLMKETKSQNQQACQKKKYTSQKNENIVCRRKHHLMRERGCKN
jgi:hypothetical protein